MMDIKTRKQAMLDGENTYFTGTPCKNGHITYRYVQSGTCYECINGHRISADSNAAKLRESRLAETSSALKVKTDAKSSLVLVKVRIVPKVREQVAAAAFALANLRYPCLSMTDVDPERAPTDRHPSSGQVLYSFYCHDDDVAMLRLIAKEAVAAVTPTLQVDMKAQIAMNVGQAIAAGDIVDSTPPMSFK